jgi:mRNA-capping enzyme
LLLVDGVFFIAPEDHDAKLTVSLTHSMHFPSPKDLNKPQHRTLLDGRFIFDTEKGTSTTKVIPRYLAMDILAHEGGILVHRPFIQRRKFLMDGVYGARKRFLQRKPEEENECFRFRVHDTFELRKTEYLLSATFLQQVTHDVDGLQFIPIEAPYKLSTAAATTTDEDGNSASVHNKLLIWKQSDGQYLSSATLLAQIQKNLKASNH